ncbi:phosphorylase b kinase regulatory subunit alpha, liver isoform-like [Hydractinia symbiolongicarpus]|uniref:phosphorylase b kinase regulatory subunit alpha, liver isoform-like n=1 Tax=Hydractinia symbiolongicarpus TaxID=13093 RepID=UPI00254F6EF4|nr:phosphorylase b kinase regulatory subunit alpha, liver isoform-like [Hydractinia symbiolongicarpus]
MYILNRFFSTYQEILTYLTMFVKIDLGLFNEMLQIRVGLIMEVLAAEYARVSGLTGEDAADDLMNVSPFQMKSLLYFILSGKEFNVEQNKLYFRKVFE